MVTGLSSSHQDVSSSSEKFAWKMLRDSKERRRLPLLTFSDLSFAKTPEFLQGINRGFGKNSPYLGIFNCRELMTSFVLHNDNLLTDCSIGILLSEKIDTFMQIGSGFRPLGKGGKITTAGKNVIHKIDNKPAVSFYREYFGDKILTDTNFFKSVTLRYPLGFRIKGFSEFIIARPLNIQPDGSLKTLIDIPSENIKLMISTRDFLASAVQRVANDFVKKASRPKIALLFDSVYRFRLLGAGYDNQLGVINDILGDIPLIGGISFYRMGAPSFSRIDIGNFIWEHSFSFLGLGGR